MPSFAQWYQQSIEQPETFWAEQAKRIHWHRPYDTVLDYSEPPFARWFVGGQTNLCYNAVDRHAQSRPEQAALIYVSTETNTEHTYTFAQLHHEVQRMAAVLRQHGVVKGDRVLIYMPMVPEAVFAMLACARMGAIHSVVFGGFASVSLASRIDDCAPKVIVSADAGSRAGKVVPYKPLLDEAIALASHKPSCVLLTDRGLAPMNWVAGRDVRYTEALQALPGVLDEPVTWLDATDPSYILYTSGTTGKPKGVQRDTGGYAVALATSMETIFMGQPGETYFSTSDIGWVVGHSYIVYGPLLAGMATILYEGLPIRPDASIWWELVQKHRVTAMFSAPTAIRVLKKYDTDFIRKHDLS
ncbi:MAG: AMP-binding protein, partial [Burkholderiaceae bacterium]